MHGFGVKSLTEPPEVAANFQLLQATKAAVPPQVSYENDFLLPVPDQGNYNTCVAFGSSALLEYWHKCKHGIVDPISQRATFSRARARFDPTDRADDGLNVYQGLRTLQEGWTLESARPYASVRAFPELLEPTPDADIIASKVVLTYQRVDPGVDDMRAALSQAGPLIIALEWNGHWTDNVRANGDTLPAPAGLGGDLHCVVIVGYDDTRKAFRIRNSWGDDWGDHGHCWLPYAFATAFPKNWPANRYTASAS
jgi:C1A family cysteine protease